MGKPVYIPHWAHLQLLSGSIMGVPIWACPYGTHMGPISACPYRAYETHMGKPIYITHGPIWACYLGYYLTKTKFWVAIL